jgi:hypothetical protein
LDLGQAKRDQKLKPAAAPCRRLVHIKLKYIEKYSPAQSPKKMSEVDHGLKHKDSG